MCPKVSAQYKIEVKGKIVESALIAFSKYGYDKARMDDKGTVIYVNGN